MKKLLFFLSVCSLLSCSKDIEIADNSPISFVSPEHFPQPVYNFGNNPVTPDGFLLGKKLFYDTRLSRNNTISCGSCHLQSNAFSHVDHPVSHGIDDLLGIRNAPAIQNMAWRTSFFWDGGVHDLDLFSMSPIQDPVEMGETLPNVLNKLRSTEEYPKLFEAAFGSSEITTARTMQALSQFMCMLVSSDSRYDKFIRGNASALSAEEKEGLNIFRQKCNSCHTEPLFTNNEFRNNGLDTGWDFGRYRVTLMANDKYLFKVPSLRNVEKTKPYMHNGKVKTIEDVLEHYRSGIVHSSTLDTTLKNGIALSDDQKTKLVLFLKSLTDETFIRDERFSE